MRTKSRRSNGRKINMPLLNAFSNSHPWHWCCFAPRGATMIPALTGVFGSATAQDNTIPTSTQISYDLACICWLHITPRGMNGLDVMLYAIATDSDSIVKRDSEEKLLCVKCVLRTKSFTQSRTPRTSSSLMAIRPRLTKKFCHVLQDHR